ncbi:MAG: ribosome silencing factor [Alphaproteobacteria bacterium]|nr:ribosome silencing factor [Alphaproteobacteria bacterium]
MFDCLDNGKALDLIKINLTGRVGFADYLIIATGTSTRHVMALADNLAKDLKQSDYLVQVEGKNSDGNWVVVDTGDVIVHLFTEEVREYYALEHMWQV